jgi:hypothetical protein
MKLYTEFFKEPVQPGTNRLKVEEMDIQKVLAGSYMYSLRIQFNFSY